METLFQQTISTVSLSPEHREMHEQAAVRLRERLVVTPYYREMDERYGMDFWRRLEGSRGGLAERGI